MTNQRRAWDGDGPGVKALCEGGIRRTREQGVAILRSASQSILTASKWTKGALAHDRRGREANPFGGSATKWSLAGHIILAGGPNFWDEGDATGGTQEAFVLVQCALAGRIDQEAFEALRAPRTMGGRLGAFNDAPGTKHGDVRELLTYAIAGAASVSLDPRQWPPGIYEGYLRPLEDDDEAARG